MGGAIVQWLRDGLGLIARSDQIEALAASVPDSDGVFLVPAHTGLGRHTGIPTHAAPCSA
jgi:glycerol kinase